MTIDNNHLKNRQYTDIIKEALDDAVPMIIAIQQHIMNGDTSMVINDKEVKLVNAKGDGSAVTIADINSQAIIIDKIREHLGDKVFAVAEEEGVVNHCTEEECEYRLIVDPIDGTGNYSGKKNAPANSNFLEGEKKENHAADKNAGRGWGSMLAIQKHMEDGTFKTVASGIYESSEKDTPENIQGRMFIAEENIPETRVHRMNDADANGKLGAGTPLNSRKRYKDSWPDAHVICRFADKEARLPMDKVMKQHGSKETNLNCVAQSALAVVSGQAQAYYQGQPYLHDAAAVSYIARKAEVPVVIMPEIEGKDGKPRFPIIMAKDEQLLKELVDAYSHVKGYDKDNLNMRNGDFTKTTYKERFSHMEEPQPVVEDAIINPTRKQYIIRE